MKEKDRINQEEQELEENTEYSENPEAADDVEVTEAAEDVEVTMAEKDPDDEIANHKSQTFMTSTCAQWQSLTTTASVPRRRRRS